MAIKIDSIKDSKLLNEFENIGIKKLFDEELVILQSGDKVSLIPIVLKGNIKVLKEDESGKEILLYYINEGESCIMSILSARYSQPSQVRAIVSEGAELLLLTSDYIKNLFINSIYWNEFVFNLYQKRFEELIEVINELAFNSVDQRIFEHLKEKVKVTGDNELVITHQQIADELGTAREVVSRLLKKLENAGKVKLKRGKIETFFLE